MQYESRFAQVTDDDLLGRLASLLADSRRSESDLVAHIGEVEERRLYAREGCPSMFAYCTQVLHLSEAEAYLRIWAARASRKHPLILDMLGDGRLHLSGIALLVPHLTHENEADLLARATHRTKRQIEELISEIAPRPDAPVVIRRVPSRTAPVREPHRGGLSESPRQLRPDGVGSSVTSAPVVKPLAPARYKVQFTASAELLDKLEELQKLMNLDGADLAVVIEQAVTEKLERLRSKRFAVTRAPRAAEAKPSAMRHLPAWLKRAVYARDAGRCQFTDRHGRRCPETHRLEFHHRYPYGLGGDHSLRNVCLLCPAHNQYQADCDYGRATMARHRSSGVSKRAGTG